MAAKNTTTKNLYFVTTTVVNWVDIFSRPKYKHIIIESLAFCQKNKGLEIYSVVKKCPNLFVFWGFVIPGNWFWLICYRGITNPPVS